jgi:hypothetical protein
MEQLRADIDSGRTGEKVPGSDPAAAPLGTDDEAAGGPAAPRSIEVTRQYETRRPSTVRPAHHDLGAAWILLGFTGFLCAGLIAWAAIR